LEGEIVSIIDTFDISNATKKLLKTTFLHLCVITLACHRDDNETINLSPPIILCSVVLNPLNT